MAWCHATTACDDGMGVLQEMRGTANLQPDIVCSWSARLAVQNHLSAHMHLRRGHLWPPCCCLFPFSLPSGQLDMPKAGSNQ